MKTVFVGMSGGVDSSVTAALVKEAGYNVVGVYMKNWSQDLPGFPCPWKEDYQDAKRVAVRLGIDFRMFDFETEYRQKVVDYMIEEYKLGRTPNPDIMCNQEIKFRLFLDTAIDQGADMIATGHYACTRDGELFKAVDVTKDQTYFLYRATSEALARTLFPLGEYTKPQVRTMAADRGLITAQKKESMGICFVGKVGIKEFLQQYVQTEAGAIIDQFGREIGEHDGAIFYTIGQRSGMHVGGGLPYYVVGKDMNKNEVYVTTQIDDERLWKKEIVITGEHWIKRLPSMGETYMVRTRHRAPLVACKYEKGLLRLQNAERAITPGQSVVLYDEDLVLGGAIVV